MCNHSRVSCPGEEVPHWIVAHGFVDLMRISVVPNGCLMRSCPHMDPWVDPWEAEEPWGRHGSRECEGLGKYILTSPALFVCIWFLSTSCEALWSCHNVCYTEFTGERHQWC